PPGQQREEAVAIWDAARDEAPRLHAAFDAAWFAGLLASATAAAPPSDEAAAHAPAGELAALPLAPRGQDWGEAPDLIAFQGRALLRARRSLLVLDNLETVLEPGAPEVGYREGYAGYGQMLQWLGEAGHSSCLMLTSRELPPEMGPRAGAHTPVRTLRLGGVDAAAWRALLADRGL